VVPKTCTSLTALQRYSSYTAVSEYGVSAACSKLMLCRVGIA